jgi:hypothetical protein
MPGLKQQKLFIVMFILERKRDICPKHVCNKGQQYMYSICVVIMYVQYSTLISILRNKQRFNTVWSSTSYICFALPHL